jgi:hypothetical protein
MTIHPARSIGKADTRFRTQVRHYAPGENSLRRILSRTTDPAERRFILVLLGRGPVVTA